LSMIIKIKFLHFWFQFLLTTFGISKSTKKY